MTIPDLPEPLSMSMLASSAEKQYTADQMRAFGEACYLAGMERAAHIAKSFATCGCNGAHGRCNEDDQPNAIAAAIRAEAAKEPE